MKLVSFTVEKYRSIIKARKIAVSSRTTLVGPNNEGKSNILKALVAAMSILVRQSYIANPHLRPVGSNPRTMLSRGSVSRRDIYDWDRDFPLSLRKTKRQPITKITLEFELTPEEVADFKALINSNLNGTLPIQVRFSPDDIELNVAKQGRGSKTLNRKKRQIARFISDRVDFHYIPAVRTAQNAKDVVDNLMERELRGLEFDPDYQAASEKIVELQRPVLTDLSDGIQQTIRDFLPSVKSVEISIRREHRIRALRSGIDIIIDDGTETSLTEKGDGIQSLVALAIMKHASQLGTMSEGSIIAIEEPESHLHPQAIHRLRDVITDIAAENQVVLSTHSPLFVNRKNVGNNIIVSDNQAKSAKNIEEIRSTLGVRFSDNLRGAELVLLVEGECDSVSLSSILREGSELVEKSLDSGRLIVESLSGAGNLSYRASFYHNSLCSVLALLDHDEPGRVAAKKCLEDNILSRSEVTHTICKGMKNSELEDLFDQKLYENQISAQFGVILPKHPRGSQKWSEWLRECFKNQGKLWDGNVEKEVKIVIAQAVQNTPQLALIRSLNGPIVSVERELEKRLT